MNSCSLAYAELSLAMTSSKTSSQTPSHVTTWKSTFANAIFWGYHFFYLMGFTLIGVQILNGLVLMAIDERISLRTVLWDLVTLGGFLPWHIVLMVFALILTPMFAMGFATLPRVREKPTNLLKLF